MNIFTIIASALILMPIAATAQEQEPTERQAEDLPVAPIFTGLKFGSGLHYQSTTAKYALPRIKSSIDTKKGDLGYRFHVGYAAQVGNVLVVGSEAGIEHGGATLTAASDLGDYSLKPSWSWDASARAGVLAAPSVLMYARAGYSWQRIEEQTDFTAIASRDLNTSSTKKGFLFGGGVEAKFTDRLFVRAEYDRMNYRNGLKTSKAMIAFISKL